MEYLKEEQMIIKEVKLYLKAMRTIKRERYLLLEEYNDQPTPVSPSYQESKGTSLSQVTRMNEYAFKRDLILEKLKIFNEVIDEFIVKTLLLPTRQRQIIDVYMNALSYAEMLDELNKKYYISESTYKRELPKICLSLSLYIQYEDVPSIENINKLYYQRIES